VDKARLLQVSESTLKHPHEQFPIAPPKEEPHWPDAKVRDMTSESIDVFLFCRTWYEFAQKPLPPPDDDPRPVGQDYDKAIYRIPKQMVTQLFRQYPARAQVYIAEMLEFEGWFDSDGWDVVRSFESLAAQQQGDPELIGKDSKYHSRLAWDKSYEMYKDFGRKNGLYIPPSEFEKLFKKGQMARDHFKLGPDQMPQEIPPDWRVGEKAESVKAVSKLYYSRYFRRLANYDAFFYQAEGEKDPITTAARKFIFAAERQRKGKTFSESTLRLYDQAWQLYVHAALKYPRFAQVTAMQEELCEVHQRYLEASQRHHAEAFRKSALTHAKAGFSPYAMEAGSVSFHTPETLAAALAFWPPTDWRGALAAQAFTGNYFLDDYGTLTARLAYWPSSGWREAIVSFHFIRAAEKDQQQVQKIVPIPKRFGPLDRIEYYDGPMAKELKEDFLFRWTLGAGLCTNMSVAGTITLPGHEYLLLSRVIAPNQEEAVENWRPIMSEESRRITADRLNLNR